MVLGTGVDCLDLHFLGTPEVIATVLLHGPQGVAVLDPGPSTTLPALGAALNARGFALADVRAILLTHIHLDHAGATGSLAQQCPHAQVYVHERGARHMADPTKLIASATRLYGDDMKRLWGDIKPVPADRLSALSESGPSRLSIVGHELEWRYTPGHASHHVSYFLPSARLAFVGDTAGLCRPSSGMVLPATPPPDIDLEAWRVSTERILSWHPEQLVLTHFGAHPAPRVHFGDFWRRLDEWSRLVQTQMNAPGSDDDHAAAFADAVSRELVRTAGPLGAAAYTQAGRFDYSWSGLARYWRARAGR